MSERFNGTVKFFSNDRGYGFISAGENEYFVHYSNLVMDGYKTLKQDQKVTFELLETERGTQAVSVNVEE